MYYETPDTFLILPFLHILVSTADITALIAGSRDGENEMKQSINIFLK